MSDDSMEESVRPIKVKRSQKFVSVILNIYKDKNKCHKKVKISVFEGNLIAKGQTTFSQVAIDRTQETFNSGQTICRSTTF